MTSHAIPSHSALPEFISTDPDGRLVLDGVRAEAVADQFGTPVFVMLDRALRCNLRRFREAFEKRYPEQVLVCVGLKANYGLAERRVLVEEGAGGDAFGLGELEAALRMGTDPAKLVMNGPNKSPETLRVAIDAGIMINVDNRQELDSIAALASRADKRARVSLRIRPPFRALDGHLYTDARFTPPGVDLGLLLKRHKFGMEPASLMDVLERAIQMDHIDVEGFHTHAGLPRRVGLGRTEIEDLLVSVRDALVELDFAPRYLNVGGGFTPPRVGRDEVTSIEEYARSICEPIVAECRRLAIDVPILICEPGRFCFESAGVWLTRVGQTKRDTTLARKRWAYVDGNINEMGDPFDPFARWHHIVIANDVNRGGEIQEVDVCGQLCNAEDVLARDRPLPAVAPGDLLAFLDMGAYNEAFANNANAVPRSAAVMVRERQVEVVRRRETVDDIYARDRLPSWLQVADLDPGSSMNTALPQLRQIGAGCKG